MRNQSHPVASGGMELSIPDSDRSSGDVGRLGGFCLGASLAGLLACQIQRACCNVEWVPAPGIDGAVSLVQ